MSLVFLLLVLIFLMLMLLMTLLLILILLILILLSERLHRQALVHLPSGDSVSPGQRSRLCFSMLHAIAISKPIFVIGARFRTEHCEHTAVEAIMVRSSQHGNCMGVT